MTDAAVFDRHRGELLAHAYRMLGDRSRALDVVQDAWLRWSGREAEVLSPRGFLIKTVTNLCLNELGRASTRREHASGDELPEPVDLSANPLERVALVEQVSMAFMVALQRLSANERAVLLLHEVFGLGHTEIGEFIGKTPSACRKLLSRARQEIETGRRALHVSAATHRRLLAEFASACVTGDAERLASLLVDDAELVVDAGPKGARFGGARNLPGPLIGRVKVAAFVATVTPREAAGVHVEERRLNDEPALVTSRDGQPIAAIFIVPDGDQIAHVFIQADPTKLSSLSPSAPSELA